MSLLTNLEEENKKKIIPSHERWDEYKSKGKSDQQRRREEFLKRQKEKRRELTEQIRKLAQEENSEKIDEPISKKKKLSQVSLESSSSFSFPNENIINDSMELTKKKLSKEERKKQAEERRIQKFKNQLMLPEPLTDIPSDLVSGWFCLPFPSNSRRCIVISSNGMTTSRLIDGTTMNRFPTTLPNGSQATRESKGNFCILDCAFHEESKTYFVLDIMAWKGCLYYDCATDFRLFWLHSKLSETNSQTISPNNPFRFVPLPFYECDRNGIVASLEGSLPKDGLFFYNKQSNYIFGEEPSPLLCSLPLHLVPQFLATVFGPSS